MPVMSGPAAHAATDVFFRAPRPRPHGGAFFWVLAWLVILFAGLTPVPPEIELIIVAALLAHVFWFACRRMRRTVLASALARAERAEVPTTAGPVTWD
jgi:hypothetical protein